ncbi:protein WFDC10B-like [Rhynchocyon petersi]
MTPRALLPTLFLYVLLLQSLGGPIHRKMRKPIRVCEDRPSVHLCYHHCSYFQKCPANYTCCLTFCGNICLSLP